MLQLCDCEYLHTYVFQWGNSIPFTKFLFTIGSWECKNHDDIELSGVVVQL